MNHQHNRRRFLKSLLALGLSASAIRAFSQPADQLKIVKKIPSSGEPLPAVGVGSARTFDALHDEALMRKLTKVLQVFFDEGGTLIDSSPMYGTAQSVIGKLLKEINTDHALFAATKVWTDGRKQGIEQIEHSRQLWGIKRFDLLQIHNLRDWQEHLPTLREMKERGSLRYIGITTSHGRFHDELESILRKEPFDFVQLSYNIEDRAVEKRLLPLAEEKGIAVIVNRPFQKGALFGKTKTAALPSWASEIDVHSWGQYFLKYIIAHPAVTNVIPATTKTKHMLDNMGAQYGRLPDSAMRKEMEKYYKQLS